MNGQTCLSDLMERGIQKMDALHVGEGTMAVTRFAPDGTLLRVCALGAMLLGAEIELSAGVGVNTSEALDWIADVCPSIWNPVEGYFSDETPDRKAKVGAVIWNMNDGTGWFKSPKPLNEILIWLRTQGL